MTESDYAIEGQKFWGREGTNDFDVIRSCRCEYVLPNTDGYESGSFILDIGAHIGGFSLWAAQKYHNSRIIAVEALPENQALFMKNVEANNLQERISLIRAAAWSTREPTLIIPYGDANTESGRVHFFIGNAGARQQPGIKQVVARTISLKEIMSGVPKVWCLKADAEGAEYPMFEEAESDDLNRIKWIIGEYHDGINRLRPLILRDDTHFVEREYPSTNLGYFCFENTIPFHML